MFIIYLFHSLKSFPYIQCTLSSKVQTDHTESFRDHSAQANRAKRQVPVYMGIPRMPLYLLSSLSSRQGSTQKCVLAGESSEVSGAQGGGVCMGILRTASSRLPWPPFISVPGGLYLGCRGQTGGSSLSLCGQAPAAVVQLQYNPHSSKSLVFIAGWQDLQLLSSYFIADTFVQNLGLQFGFFPLF